MKFSASTVAIWVCLAWAVSGQGLSQRTFNFFLTGSQEVPPNTSNAFGRCVVVLNQAQTEIKVTCTHNVADATAGHIHKAAADQTGGVRFPFASPASPIDATFNVTAADVTDLLAGQLYVNIHNAEFPAGVIRGQIVNSETTFHTLLQSSQEVPAAFSSARGNCRGVLNAAHTQFALRCTHTVENPTAAHIHRAAAGASGPVIFPLDPISPMNSTWSPNQEQVNDLFAGRLYVNIHSAFFPPGEVRGQLSKSEVRFDFPLEPEQENPPANSRAEGRCVGVLNEGHIAFQLRCTHNVTNPTASHIHRERVGVNGPVVFGLGAPPSPIVATWKPTAEQLTDLFSGILYVNVHSSGFPPGEIRGQIVDEEHDISHIAQVGDGDGVHTDLVITNPSSTAAVSGLAEFRNDQGRRADFGLAEEGGFAPLASTTNGNRFNIDPLGSVTISTNGLGNLTAGSARIFSSGPVGAVARFNIPGSGIAGVGVSEPLRRFVIPVRRTQDGINTGVALVNTGRSAVKVTLTLRNQDGQDVPDGVVVIEEFGGLAHLAQFVDEIFEDADTEGFRGTVVVEVEGGAVAATALELGSEPGQFTALPVTPLQ